MKHHGLKVVTSATVLQKSIYMSSKQSQEIKPSHLTHEQYQSYLEFMRVCEELSDNRPEHQEDMFLNMDIELNN
mgnify:CR=1 FL=1|tara:strand:- start:100 stop:321 length:222 start_codon:yes stop_codon:yes gene_type:complete